MTIGDWNQQQSFDERGVLFLIGEATGGGYMVLRMDVAKLPAAIVAASTLATEQEAVAAARRLRLAALN